MGMVGGPECVERVVKQGALDALQICSRSFDPSHLRAFVEWIHAVLALGIGETGGYGVQCQAAVRSQTPEEFVETWFTRSFRRHRCTPLNSTDGYCRKV